MEAVRLQGVVRSVIYYNDENGYGIVAVSPDRPVDLWDALDEDGLVTIVGLMPPIGVDEQVQVSGQWSNHPVYGRQVKVESIQSLRPATSDGIRNYLASGLIKGGGRKLAGRIVDYFGEETLEILDHHPERLEEVDGISSKKIKQITRSWREHNDIKNVMLFLQGHGISTNLAIKVYT
ncbi:MAG: ATP-dependent RecD-like DNA helicase, partial [Chloroflexi bacterium]|nr:ATP-dependent RecD-like DNA helicase [Chloroflexota bacterium]